MSFTPLHKGGNKCCISLKKSHVLLFSDRQLKKERENWVVSVLFDVLAAPLFCCMMLSDLPNHSHAQHCSFSSLKGLAF